MTKQRLNHQQQRRIRSQRDKQLASLQHEGDDSFLAEPCAGRVLSRFGQHADIEGQDGLIQRCNLRRSVESLVCGDNVLWRPSLNPQESGVVIAVQPRHSELARPDFYDGLKPVAANIDQMIIVSAIRPEFSTNILDRYLIVAENLGLTPCIVLNKIDLLGSKPPSFAKEWRTYEDLGYTCLPVSHLTGEGIDALQQQLADKISLFVGQSGVGKSSLINTLIPHLQVHTGDISKNSGLGQHTTTVARLYHFPSGGDLIDSPGIREFSLWHLSPQELAAGFVEFQPMLGHCKFRDCKHLTDPGCQLRQAVADGLITQERFDNYHSIVASTQEMRHGRTQARL